MELIKYCPLFSGSTGNSAYLEAGSARILIDAGMSARAITLALNSIGVDAGTLNAIVVTHEHIDHVRGIGVLCRKHGIAVYANAPTWEGMEKAVGDIAPSCVRVIDSTRDFYIKDVNVQPFITPHDAAQSVGYAFCYRKKRMCSVTDIGHVDSRLLDELSGSDLIMLEANHDVEMLKAGKYPYQLKRRILSSTGHLSNDAAGAALVKLCLGGLNNCILGHLSRENNYPPVALATIRSILSGEGIADDAINLTVALSDKPTGIFCIE